MSLPRVVILADTGRGHHRGLVRGVVAYALTEGRNRWVHRVVSTNPCREHALLEFPQKHGVVGALVSEGRAMDLALAAGLPAICTSGVSANCPVPRVRSDDAAIGARVAEYLLNQGLRHFACVPFDPPIHFAERRHAGFRDTLAARGFGCTTFRAGPYLGSPPLVIIGALEKWLKKLEKPVGIMAANDDVGADVVGVCREAGLRVPDEVAVVGVDNDDLVCEATLPSLSSVAQRTERIGYEAADLLTRMLEHGKGAVPQLHLIEPGDVVVRGSSEALPGDPLVREALTFLRSRFADRIKVENVADHVGTCRKTLDVRFKTVIGRTPAAEIHRLQMATAKRLLQTTALPMAAVARAAGFVSARQFSESFRQAEAQTPTEFRRRWHSPATEPPSTPRADLD